MKTKNKVICFIFSLLLIHVFGKINAQNEELIAASNVKILECIDVDSVTADFPVGFSSVSHNNWQFVAYYNKNRNMTVASRKITSDSWNYKILPAKVGWDTHNRITMTIDRDSCLHVTGNMHNDSMTYFKTEKPLDISTFKKVFPLVSVEDELSCTYPGFLKTPDKQVIFSYRKGGSGNGIIITSIYDEKTKTFKRLSDKPLFDGLNQMSAYASGPRLSPDGYYHLTWLWRDTPRCETNHSPSYARSKDLVNWETLDGKKLKLPITPNSTQFIVDPVPPGGGVINGAYRMFFSDDKNPLLVYMKYDEQGSNQLFIAKSENGKWTIKQVSNWNYRWEFSGRGSITFEIRLKNATVTGNDQIIIDYWHKHRGDGQIVVDLETLSLVKDNKVVVEQESEYPKELLAPASANKEMTVHWMKIQSKSQNNEEFYTFRWETMGKRRFYEAPESPVKPEPLKLYKLKTVNTR